MDPNNPNDPEASDLTALGKLYWFVLAARFAQEPPAPAHGPMGPQGLPIGAPGGQWGVPAAQPPVVLQHQQAPQQGSTSIWEILTQYLTAGTRQGAMGQQQQPPDPGTSSLPGTVGTGGPQFIGGPTQGGSLLGTAWAGGPPMFQGGPSLFGSIPFGVTSQPLPGDPWPSAAAVPPSAPPPGGPQDPVVQVNPQTLQLLRLIVQSGMLLPPPTLDDSLRQVVAEAAMSLRA